jgi:hypothetical protein
MVTALIGHTQADARILSSPEGSQTTAALSTGGISPPHVYGFPMRLLSLLIRLLAVLLFTSM